jgi:hypothetical protein
VEIKGWGHVPSFKNAKRMCFNRKTGKPFPVTEKRVKQWMDNSEDSIVSQLFSMCQTTADETQPECLKQLQTFLSGLSDDSVREIPEGSWSVLKVPAGCEGVSILIERI